MWKIKSLFFVSFLVISFLLNAQVNITGKILSNAGNEPISNASVYINNTTIGFNTGATGEFVLRGIKPGAYEIIVSHVGYDMIVHRVEVKGQDLKFEFRVVEKVKQMRNIVVMTSDLRKKWMENFRQYFLGQTVAAQRTKIKNEEDILFEKGPARSSMIAFSETPLIIENKDLGYRIYFELVEFFYDQNEGRTYFFGFSRFEEINENEKVKRKYKKIRENYYRGSTQHFYHSLLANDLDKQQFSIYLSKKMENNSDKSTAQQQGASTQKTADKNSPRLAIAVTVPDILFRSDSTSGRSFMKWEGDLHVRYRLNPYAKNHLKTQGFYDGFLPTGVQSGISMLISPAYIDPNGSLDNPMSVQYSGYWAFERVASMLPIDYRPEGSREQ